VSPWDDQRVAGRDWKAVINDHAIEVFEHDAIRWKGAKWAGTFGHRRSIELSGAAVIIRFRFRGTPRYVRWFGQRVLFSLACAIGGSGMPPIFAAYLRLAGRGKSLIREREGEDGGLSRYLATDIDALNVEFLSDLNFGAFPEAGTSPGVSRDMVRAVLRDEQKQGRVECLGRGPAAAWRKGNTAFKEVIMGVTSETKALGGSGCGASPSAEGSWVRHACGWMGFPDSCRRCPLSLGLHLLE